MALNLGVTSCQSLEISLDQFVRGEVLEGSNAYYCEKCKEKVSRCMVCVLYVRRGSSQSGFFCVDAIELNHVATSINPVQRTWECSRSWRVIKFLLTPLENNCEENLYQIPAQRPRNSFDEIWF